MSLLKVSKRYLHSIVYLIFGGLFPLLIGGILYYLYAPNVYFVKVVDRCLSNGYHIYVDLNQNSIVRWIRYYLLDFLWSFSFANVVFVIYSEHKHVLKIGCLVPIALGGCIEALQFYGIITGTVDIYDLVVEIIGSLGAGLIFTCVRRTMYERN